MCQCDCRITGAYKIYAEASWGPFSSPTIGSDSEVPFDLTAYNWDINLGSWCYFLFPPSPPPSLPPSITTAGSSNSSTTSDSQATQVFVTARFTLAVSPESFDQSAFVSLLRKQFPSADDILVSIIYTDYDDDDDGGGRRLTSAEGTVIVEVTFVAGPSVASSISAALTSTSPAEVSSSWLGGSYTVTAVGAPTSTTSSSPAAPLDDGNSMIMTIGIAAGATVMLIFVFAGCYMMRPATPSAVDESKPDADISSTSVELTGGTVPVDNPAGVDNAVAPAVAVSVAAAVVSKPPRAPTDDLVA